MEGKCYWAETVCWAELKLKIPNELLQVTKVLKSRRRCTATPDLVVLLGVSLGREVKGTAAGSISAATPTGPTGQRSSGVGLPVLWATAEPVEYMAVWTVRSGGC